MMSRCRRNTARRRDSPDRGASSSALLAGAALAVALLVAALIPGVAQAPSPPRVPPPGSSSARPAPDDGSRRTPAKIARDARRALEAMRPRLLEAIRARAATAPAESKPDAGETYDPRRVLTQLGEGVLPLVRPCYEAALARRPGLAGHLVLVLDIESDPVDGGTIEAADFTDESTISDPEMRACVRESLLAVTFDAPPAPSGRLTVKYPIDFTP